MAEVVGRSSEGEKAFPFKKRRSGGYNWGALAGGETVEEKKKSMRCKVKRNTSNRCEEKVEEEEEEEEGDSGDDDDYDDEEERAATVMRRKGRKAGGGLLKRGSRCSRVNGRGWQCSHQTLAGYSLCEHHLGKGRTKSIGSMVGIRRSGARGPSRNTDDNGDENDYDNGLSRTLLPKKAKLVEDDDEKKEAAITCSLLPTVVVKKKKRGRRLGGWKRLDSSLLSKHINAQ